MSLKRARDTGFLEPTFRGRRRPSRPGNRGKQTFFARVLCGQIGLQCGRHGSHGSARGQHERAHAHAATRGGRALVSRRLLTRGGRRHFSHAGIDISFDHSQKILYAQRRPQNQSLASTPTPLRSIKSASIASTLRTNSRYSASNTLQNSFVDSLPKNPSSASGSWSRTMAS